MSRLLAFAALTLIIVSFSPSIYSYDPKHDFLVNDEVNKVVHVIPKLDYVDIAHKYNLDPKKIVCFPSPDDDGSCIMAYTGKIEQINPISMMIKPGGQPLHLERSRFYLHTKKTQGLEKPIELFVETDEGDNERAKEFFNKDGPVKVLVHGYHSDSTKSFPKSMMEDYIEFLPDVNVIVVDWSKQAGDPSVSKWYIAFDYYAASENTEYVGERAAALFKRLVAEKFTTLDKIHLIGHSLGSHVGGYTGHYLKPEKMGRVTGLDPAAPAFCNLEGQLRRLSIEDAEFVDIIHSDGGNLCDMKSDPQKTWDAVVGSQKIALFEDLGHIDFYPNGGSGQPGCDKGSCSHSRSHDLMRATIHPKNEFVGHRSRNWLEFLNNESPYKETALMGERCTNTARGLFFLRTGDLFPYALS